MIQNKGGIPMLKIIISFICFTFLSTVAKDLVVEGPKQKVKTIF